MTATNPFAPPFNELPDILPVFPLQEALLLPFGRLPLNIFEPRYLAMIRDAMAGNRMIGMVQPQDTDPDAETPPIFDVGCAGKITDFSETENGRYVIMLTGISRFKIKKEVQQKDGYRRVEASWSGFEDDVLDHACLGLNREKLGELLQQYFKQQGMSCDWKAVENAPDGKLITCLSMACPFEPAEKQALLEAKCCKTRAGMFMTMLEIALKSGHVDTGAFCNKNKH